jgi:hypothetical protein
MQFGVAWALKADARIISEAMDAKRPVCDMTVPFSWSTGRQYKRQAEKLIRDDATLTLCLTPR